MNDYDSIGVLGNYLNDSIPQPNLPRLLLWNGRFKLEGDERVLETFFLANRELEVKRPFSIDDWNIKSYSPAPDIRVSLVPFLRLGSIWNGKGRELKDLDKGFLGTYEFEIAEPLSLNPVKFYSIDEYKAFAKSFSFPSATAKSFVIAYPKIDAIDRTRRKRKVFFKRVIIPCFEIARFYFFNSSTLTKALLTPGSLDDNNNLLYVPDQNITPVDGTNIVTKPKISVRIFNEADILIVSRIAFSREAKRAVSLIQKSTLDPFGYIASHFPFSTKTSLNVRGFEINILGDSYLFVTELLSCTGHFPFNELRYTYDWPITKGGDEKKGGSGDPKPGKPNNKKLEMTDKPPTPLSGNFRVIRKVGKRFLSAPKRDHLTYFEPESKDGDHTTNGHYDPDNASDGENRRPDKKKRRPKLEALNKDQDALDKNRLDRFEFFSKILAWLTTNGYSAAVMQPYEESPSSYPIHLSQFKYKRWCYVAKDVARGVAIALIKHDDLNLYLFEHQQRHSNEKIGLRLIWRRMANDPNESSSLEAGDVEVILLTFARNNGGLGRLKNIYNVRSFRHHDNYQKICENILATMGSIDREI